VRGEVTVRTSPESEPRFVPGARLATSAGRDLVVVRSRRHHGRLIVAFEGCTDRDAAEQLRGSELRVPAAERRELEDDEYWPEELVGIVVVDRHGNRLGWVDSVVLGEVQDRLVVATSDGRLVEVPFVDEIVADLHPSGGFAVIDPPEGLF